MIGEGPGISSTSPEKLEDEGRTGSRSVVSTSEPAGPGLSNVVRNTERRKGRGVWGAKLTNLNRDLLPSFLVLTATVLRQTVRSLY